MDLDLTNIERIAALILLVMAGIGTLYTSVSTANNVKNQVESQKENEKLIIKKEINGMKIAKDIAELDAEDRRIDLAAKLKAFYKEEFETIDAKYDEVKIDLGKINDELERVRKEKNTLKQAGLLLIKAVKESLGVRKVHDELPEACQLCLAGDTILLKTLSEVKALFENGDSEG